MRVHALARHQHYLDHLLAIWNHLPDDLLGETLLEHKPTLSHVKHWAPDDVVMVAGFPDISCAFGRRVVYVEHGAGQRYEGNRAASYYHGAEHPENVIAYIGPRQDVIDSWGRPGFAAGSPICDPYQLFAPRRVAVITFHWNAGSPHRTNVPEAGTAFDHFAPKMDDIVAALRANDWEVYGTYHPRFTRMRGFWPARDVVEVSAHEARRDAQLLIADNTSLMYEMLYLARSVIAMNSPHWRRDVEHGLRFWKHAPPVQADDPEQLIDLIYQYDELHNQTTDLSPSDIPSYVYGKPMSDGRDGPRAAMWLSSFLAGSS